MIELSITMKLRIKETFTSWLMKTIHAARDSLLQKWETSLILIRFFWRKKRKEKKKKMINQFSNCSFFRNHFFLVKIFLVVFCNICNRNLEDYLEELSANTSSSTDVPANIGPILANDGIQRWKPNISNQL